MITKVRINQDDNKMFHLIEFNANSFGSNYKLKLMTDNISTVKNIFSNLEYVEIYINNNLTAEYSSFDGYSAISYLGTLWCEGEGIFSDCLEVTLTKTDIIEQVQRIDHQLNPVIDIDSMSISELKEYKKSLISKAGSEDIYAGDTVTFTDGTTKTFTFGTHDQQNLQTYLGLIGQADQDERLALMFPYHSEGEECTFYTYDKIVTIFFTLQLKLLDRYTLVNMLRLYIDSLDDISVIREIDYNTVLPAEYQARKAEIMQASIAGIMELKEKYGLIDETPEEDVDPETPVEPEPSNDDPVDENTDNTEGSDVNEGTEE